MQIMQRGIGPHVREQVIPTLVGSFETGEGLIYLPERGVDLDQLEDPDVFGLGALIQLGQDLTRLGRLSGARQRPAQPGQRFRITASKLDGLTHARDTLIVVTLKNTDLTKVGVKLAEMRSDLESAGDLMPRFAEAPGIDQLRGREDHLQHRQRIDPRPGLQPREGLGVLPSHPVVASPGHVDHELRRVEGLGELYFTQRFIPVPFVFHFPTKKPANETLIELR